MIRPTHPAGERALDELAATRGLVRDPQAEDQAFVMGALLALEAVDLSHHPDVASRPALLLLALSMEPVRVIGWTTDVSSFESLT